MLTGFSMANNEDGAANCSPHRHRYSVISENTVTGIRLISNEDGYTWALAEIERYFASEPEPDTPEGDRFDLLALVIEDYERKQWAIEPAEVPNFVII